MRCSFYYVATVLEIALFLYPKRKRNKRRAGLRKNPPISLIQHESDVDVFDVRKCHLFLDIFLFSTEQYEM